MTRAEAIGYLLGKYVVVHEGNEYEKELNEALDMAIEILSKANYETDTEVRLAEKKKKKEKVILWDAFGEVEYYPNGEINCVHCTHYHEKEDDSGVHGHCKSHGRLIDADALSKKLCETTIFIKDGEVFQRMINDAPTVQADRPHGEWVEVVERTEQYDREGVKTWATLYQCSNCGFVLNAIEGHIGQYNFCPNCGCVMDMGGR